MTDIAYQHDGQHTGWVLEVSTWRKIVLVALSLLVAGLAITLASRFNAVALDEPLLEESTVGQLSLWLADQSTEENPESLLGQYAKKWAAQRGDDSLDEAIVLGAMRDGVVIWSGLIGLLVVAGTIGLLNDSRWSRAVLLTALLGLDLLLFVIPALESDNTLALVLGAVVVLLIVLMFAPGRVTRVLGFVVVLSALFVAWESFKALADTVDYRLTVPVSDWRYGTYQTMGDALAALENGEVTAVIADENDLEELMPPHPVPEDEEIDPETFPYSNLRFLERIDSGESRFGFSVLPAFPGRLAVAVREDEVEDWSSISQFLDEEVAAVSGDYADEDYLAVPRALELLDLKIANDLNLPHLQSIAEAFLQPARRNGPVLLVRILAEAGLYTWGEAVFGFVFGASIGFILGTAFAHSSLMERGLLPYVVASQTVPILAIAPMVVIWLGAGPAAVSVIAAYLTFFPVTINTLRGLKAPDSRSLELMHSYAATNWEILWKLRFPAALPYIFTALKVSATASVVGAIIGELPSSIRNGLGRAILDFSSNYSEISTPKLWAAIVMAAMVGIVFFAIVSVVEFFVLRRYIRSV